jgi:hypothetical protein
VLEAPDGAAGVVAARRHAAAIDVLCTDCMMQGLPVPQLIDQFRKLHNGRVLVCSGYAPAEPAFPRKCTTTSWSSRLPATTWSAEFTR